MKSKIVKCRKEHDCDLCEEKIKKGETASYSQGKGAKFDEEDRQVGVEYWKSYIHANHDYETDCPDCHHRTAYKEIRPSTQMQSGESYCSNCQYSVSFP